MSTINQLQFQKKNHCLKQSKQSNFIRKLSDLEVKRPDDIFKLCQFNQVQLFKPSMLLNKKLVKSKLIKGKSKGILQIFAIIYLRIWLSQLSQNRHSNSINSILQLIDNSDFRVNFSKNHSLRRCPQETVKSIITQFIYYIYQHCQHLTVENAFKKYPLMLDVFASIFKQLLQIQGIGQNYEDEPSIQQVYQFLALYFDIQISVDTVNNCIFFYKINTFVIQQGEGEVYIVEQENDEPKSPISILKQEQQDEEKQQYRTAKSVSGGKLSKLLTSNSSDSLMDQQVTKMVSNFQIPIQSETEFQNLPNQFISQFPLVQSNIIKQKRQTSVSIKEFINLDSQKAIKESMTNTYDSLNRKSLIENSQNLLFNFVQKSSLANNKLQISMLNTHKINNNQTNNLKNKQSKEQLNNKLQQKYANLTNKLQFQHYKIQKININHEKSRYRKMNNINNNDIFYTPQHANTSYKYQNQSLKQNKQLTKWVNKNITKEFTSSFILESVCQPYKASIEEKKKKAREQRKKIMAYNYYS